MARGQHQNLGARDGIGERLVVIQGEVELTTDVGELGGVDTPVLTRNVNCTEKGKRGRGESVVGAAGVEHATVERSVVCDQALRPLEKWGEAAPHLGERGCALDVFPGDAVNARELESRGWRTDQAHGLLEDTTL